MTDSPATASGERTSYAGTGLSFSDFNALPHDQQIELLVAAVDRLRERIRPDKEQLEQAEKLLKLEISARGPQTTILQAGELEVKIERSTRYTYDVDEGLIRLTAYGVSQEDFDVAVSRSWDVSQSALNKLKRRGGRIAEIIEENTHAETASMRLIIRPSTTLVRRDQSPYVTKFVKDEDSD